MLLQGCPAGLSRGGVQTQTLTLALPDEGLGVSPAQRGTHCSFFPSPSGAAWMAGGLPRAGRALEPVTPTLNLLTFLIVYTGKTGARLRSHLAPRCGPSLTLGVNVHGMSWSRMPDAG